MTYSCNQTAVTHFKIKQRVINATNAADGSECVLFYSEYEPLQLISMTVTSFEAAYSNEGNSEDVLILEFLGEVKDKVAINKKTQAPYLILDTYVVMPDYSVGILYVNPKDPDLLFIREREEFKAKFEFDHEFLKS